MREIRFRCWCEKSNKMTYMDQEGWFDEAFLGVNGFQQSTSKIGIVAENTTLMQYTGLQDKNGVRIFEGDVLLERYKEPDWDGREGILAEVVFHKGAFMIKEPGEDPEYTLGETYEDFEIVGNVFDNKELLEVE